MPKQRIAIIGAGIAGLTIASALDDERFEIDLYEAQPERSGTGSALGLWGSARRVLRGLDASPPLGERSTEGALRRIDGRRLVPLRGGGPVMVERPALLEALEGAGPTQVRRVSEEVTDPAALDADLVVGADGVRSRVRGMVDSRAAERSGTPYLALRGIGRRRPEPGSVGEYWGGGLLFGIVPMPGGQTYWFSTHRSDLAEPLDLDAVLAETRERFASAAEAPRRLLAEAGPDTLATRLWVAPSLRTYARDRFVVIGDAAHAMTPNLGRGACSAIVDAWTLARALNRGSDLRTWQLRRVPATQAARVGSGVLMRLALRV